MRPRPPIRCFVAMIGTNGVPFDIEWVTLEVAAARLAEGWAVIGPDPEDEAEFATWLREAEVHGTTHLRDEDEETE